VNGVGVGAHGQLTRGSYVLSPGTKYKRSKDVFTVIPVACSLGRPGLQLLELPAQSLIRSPGTLVGGLFS